MNIPGMIVALGMLAAVAFVVAVVLWEMKR